MRGEVVCLTSAYQSDDANVQVEHSSPPENASAHRVDDELALPASPTLVPQVDFEPENTTFESLLEYMGGSPSASRTGDDDEIVCIFPSVSSRIHSRSVPSL